MERSRTRNGARLLIRRHQEEPGVVCVLGRRRGGAARATERTWWPAGADGSSSSRRRRARRPACARTAGRGDAGRQPPRRGLPNVSPRQVSARRGRDGGALVYMRHGRTAARAGSLRTLCAPYDTGQAIARAGRASNASDTRHIAADGGARVGRTRFHAARDRRAPARSAEGPGRRRRLPIREGARRRQEAGGRDRWRAPGRGRERERERGEAHTAFAALVARRGTCGPRRGRVMGHRDTLTPHHWSMGGSIPLL